jgi:predicted transcriptional regulator
MSRIGLIITICISILTLSVTVSAQDFKVSEIKLSSTNWGTQKASFDLTNLGEYFSFVVATAEVDFPGNVIDSKRFTKKVFIIQPPEIEKLEMPFIIHGNIGKGTVLINFYNVVDTLDPLFESQKFYSRKFEFNIEIPKSLKAIVDSGLQVPSIVSLTGTFDNLFNRIVIFLLNRGKSLDEIAQSTGVEKSFVEKVASVLADEGLLDLHDSTYKPTFIVLENNQVEAFKPIIGRTVDDIYRTVTGNIHKYDSTLTALALKGLLTNDKSNVLDGGSILYHKYPVFLGLFLWEFLGSRFINNGNDILIYQGSDLCRARMGDYMFMIIGASDNVGTTFYNKLQSGNVDGFYCGATTPILKCGGRKWAFEQDNSPIYYTYNEDKINLPLSILAEGVNDHITDLEKALFDNFPDDKDKDSFRGVRYWCWGLVIDKLMDKLVENKVLEIEGKGVFLFQKTER